MNELSPSVLVVEDEPAQAEMLAYNLESEGFRVIRAADGSEALLLVEEEAPDLILLDWMLPGTSGIEVCRRIKLRPASRLTPVIMISTLTFEAAEAAIRALELGAFECIGKPIGGDLIKAFADLPDLVRAAAKSSRV